MLAVILVDYKNEERTARFVETELRRLTGHFALFIVSNAATPEGLALLHSRLGGTVIDENRAQKLIGSPSANDGAPSNDAGLSTGGNIYIISSSQNLGYARGNNLGARFARAVCRPEYLLFTNNDVRIENPATATLLMEKLSAHPEAACIGPRIVGHTDGKEQSPQPYKPFFDNHIWNAWAYFLWSEEHRRRYFKWDYPSQAREGLHYNVAGSFFLARSADFFAAGAFDENTFLYAEEPILAERFRAIGKGEYYDPRCTVVHEHSVTVRKYMSAKQKNDALFRSLCYYYRTYRNLGRGELLLGKLTYQFVTLSNWKKEKMKCLKEKLSRRTRP